MASPKIKTWVYTAHALKRIQERNITADELTEVIQNPDHKIPQGPKWIFAKTLPRRSDNKMAAVLLERKEREQWVVLTVLVRFEKR
jgi:hypothetical protein